MKAAVYRNRDLDLMAVVDVAQDFVDIGVRQGYIEMMVAPPLERLSPTTAQEAITPMAYRKITAHVKVLNHGSARTVAIFVEDKEDLAHLRKARGLRQVWPRHRPKQQGGAAYKRSNDYKRQKAKNPMFLR